MNGVLRRFMARFVKNNTQLYVTDKVCWFPLENALFIPDGEELKAYLCLVIVGASLKQHRAVCATSMGCMGASSRCKTDVQPLLVRR